MKFNNTHIYNTNSDCLQLYDLFSLFSLIATSVGIAFSIVGSTIYTRVGDFDDFFDDSDSDADSDEGEEEYDHLYYDELDSLEDRVLEKEYLEKLGNVIVREKTPNGEVIMTYNSKTEAFEYFCDDKNVKYMVLDTVARKFTIDNNCKSICVNYKGEFEKAKAAIMADQVTTITTTTTNKNIVPVTLAPVSHAPQSDSAASETAKRSIYAKFKNYNSVSGNNRKKEEVAKEKVESSSVAATKKEKIYILTEKANRFSYKGRISNYKDPNQVEVTNTVYKKTIDFATFKQTLYNKSD